MKPASAQRFCQRLSVPFEYPVVFTRALFHARNPCLASAICRLEKKRRHRVLVFMDRGVAERNKRLPGDVRNYFSRHANRLELAGPIVITTHGHQAKQGLACVTGAIRRMAAQRLDRHSFVMIIGGGSLLDAVGLAASLVHRGLRVIRVPTTATAQNDVGVGVKTGVDAFGAKNFLGTFAPPFAVLNDLDFLATLPARDRIAGIAEAFKVAMIRDRAFFLQLCRDARRLRTGERTATERAIIRCARLHLDHIRRGGDPFESGSARPLDFGHWSAHQLETASRYTLRHGEAVSIGLALDACIAAERGLLRPKDLDRLLRGLLQSGLPIWHPLLAASDKRGLPRIRQGLERFREHLGGELTITLPGPPGKRVEVHSISDDEIVRATALLRRRAGVGNGKDSERRLHATA